MTDKKIVAIFIILMIAIFWGSRGAALERSFVYQADAKSSNGDGGADIHGFLDSSAYAEQKSNPVGPGASSDLAASTRPGGEWKTITAYNADIAQTDSDPRITASGKEVREGFVAYNCAPFGTRIIIESREYEVQDRMAKKWGCGRVDIFMEDYQEALRFGKKQKQILILE